MWPGLRHEQAQPIRRAQVARGSARRARRRCYDTDIVTGVGREAVPASRSRSDDAV